MERLPDLIVDGDLALRRWQVEDAEAQEAAVIANLDHLRPWMPWAAAEPLGLMARRGMLERWQRDWEAGGDAAYAVLLDRALAGSCGLHRRRGPGVLEIGYWIAAERSRRGLGTRVAGLLTEAAFAVPGVDRVEIHHDRANQASAAIPRRLGYRPAGERPDTVDAPSEEGVDCTWAIERREWLESKRRGGP
jgi:ribosomal-protein-serine acetyltransferase